MFFGEEQNTVFFVFCSEPPRARVWSHPAGHVEKLRPVRPAFERRDAPLEGSARRVLRAGVLPALVNPRRGLHVGAGLKDGRHDGARGWIGFLPRVDSASVKSLHVVKTP